MPVDDQPRYSRESRSKGVAQLVAHIGEELRLVAPLATASWRPLGLDLPEQGGAVLDRQAPPTGPRKVCQADRVVCLGNSARQLAPDHQPPRRRSPIGSDQRKRPGAAREYPAFRIQLMPPAPEGLLAQVGDLHTARALGPGRLRPGAVARRRPGASLMAAIILPPLIARRFRAQPKIPFRLSSNT